MKIHKIKPSIDKGKNSDIHPSRLRKYRLEDKKIRIAIICMVIVDVVGLAIFFKYFF